MGHVIGTDTTYTGNPVSFNAVNGGKMKSISVPFSYTQDLHGYHSPWIDSEHDKVPYNFRAVSDTTASRVGNSEFSAITGGTVAWNQLSIVPYAQTIQTVVFTRDTDKKTFTAVGTPTSTVYKQMSDMGDTIVGHVYWVDKGADVDNYQIYNDGGGVSTSTTKRIGIGKATASKKFYIWLRSGVAFDFSATPQIFDLTIMFGSTIADYIYTLESGTDGAGIAKLKSWGYFTKDYYAYNAGELMSVNASAHKTYKADTTLLGNYALDSSLTLRGIPKLDANNNLYYDGDSYESSGTVTRKYASRAYTSGDATDGSTMITDGTTTVYKLTTPTTETATGFTNPQSIDPNGTEQFVDYAYEQGTRDVEIPVGHSTNYANICPISGRTGLNVYVSPTTNVADATTYTSNWSAHGTMYGGTVNVVTGQITITMENIASYNGETIGEPWVSSMDAYVFGNTPTTGAQVVYTLDTPITYQLTPKQISALVGQNYIWSSNNETLTAVLTAPATGFAGWLIKCVTNGTPVEIPLKYMRAETYTVTPDQRMEWSAERDVTGVLHRETVQNLPPKIEFNTPLMTNSDINALNSIIKAAFTNYLQRNITIQFYDPERDQYWEWDCYMPDVHYSIRNADTTNHVINYEELRYAFIGY